MSITKQDNRQRLQRMRMEAIALGLINESEITEIIRKLIAVKHMNESERLWIMYKVSQIQAGRNIISIAENGLNIMGVGRE